MNDKLTLAKNILKKYKQEHLLNFYNDISKDEKQLLLEQILNIDYEQILKLYKNSFINDATPMKRIEPLPHIEKDCLSDFDINNFKLIGENILKSQSFAIVTMAGGQGSRLRLSGTERFLYVKFKTRKKIFI